MSQTTVRFSTASKGKEPITKQRIQFHIDSVHGLPTTISSSSALSVAVQIHESVVGQHDTTFVKSSKLGGREWHENIGPFPLRETTQMTFSLRVKSKLPGIPAKVLAKSEKATLESLLAKQGTSSNARETRLHLPLLTSTGVFATLSLNIRIIPSLTVPIGTDVAKFMRAASKSQHRRSPSSNSFLSISPTPTLESDEGYMSSAASVSLPPTPATETPMNNHLLPPTKTTTITNVMTTNMNTNSKPISIPIPAIITTEPSP